MTLKTMNSGHKTSRNTHHSVRFTSDDIPKYKSLESPDNLPSYVSQYAGQDSGAPSPESCSFQPAAQRFRLNEQRIKLLTAINQIVQQRAELESNRITLSGLLDELKRKLKRRIEECHFEKRDKMKALKQANQKLEKEKFGLVSEIEHLKRHLEREESHHAKHARTMVAQAIQGMVKNVPTEFLFTPCSVADLPNVVSRNVAKNAPSRVADNKLAAARLMRDIAELRQRVAQVENRLCNELKYLAYSAQIVSLLSNILATVFGSEQDGFHIATTPRLDLLCERKRQAEVDIIRLRKELSATKSCVASLRLPPPAMRKQCAKFA